MENERGWYLITRKLAGEATPSELEELEALLKQDTAMQYSASLLEELDSTPMLAEGEEERMLQSRLAQLHLSEETPAPHRRLLPFLKWAAAAAVAALIVSAAGWHFYGKKNYKSITAREISTRPGSRTNVVLEDGTRVWLNADSRIASVQGKREVTLTGEAYFDVVSDANNPFIVHVGKIDVRVLGTTLNIKAYPGQGAVETSLIQGKLEVDLKEGNGRKILLLPGQKAVIATNSANTSDQPATVDYSVKNMATDTSTGQLAETGWLNNQLSFKQQSLPEILQELERWYGIHIELKNDSYNQEIITGTFKDKDLYQVLQALQLSAGFKFHTDSLGVHIY
ncbi:FecR family protein [Chitinophaga jiangningensis]|nr:FecR domain-containing protein [Chitinophaga jiangningensis]